MVERCKQDEMAVFDAFTETTSYGGMYVAAGLEQVIIEYIKKGWAS